MMLKKYAAILNLMTVFGVLKAQDFSAYKFAMFCYTNYSISSSSTYNGGLRNYSWGNSPSQVGYYYEPKIETTPLPRMSIGIGLNNSIFYNKDSTINLSHTIGFQYSLNRNGIVFLNEDNSDKNSKLVFNLQQWSVPAYIELISKKWPFSPKIGIGIHIAKNIRPSFTIMKKAAVESFYIYSRNDYKEFFIYPALSFDLTFLKQDRHNITFGYNFEYTGTNTKSLGITINRKRPSITTQSEFSPNTNFHNLCIKYLYSLK